MGGLFLHLMAPRRAKQKYGKGRLGAPVAVDAASGPGYAKDALTGRSIKSRSARGKRAPAFTLSRRAGARFCAFVLNMHHPSGLSYADYDAYDAQHWAPDYDALRRQWQRKPSPPDGLLTADEAAARLRCSVKTLNGYIASGAIRYVAIGHGTKRPRKMFTAADLDDFVANQTRKDFPACQSAATRARPTGNTTFRSEVIAFSARPSARTSVKPKR
jgi:hypothetical protein